MALPVKTMGISIEQRPNTIIGLLLLDVAPILKLVVGQGAMSVLGLNRHCQRGKPLTGLLAVTAMSTTKVQSYCVRMKELGCVQRLRSKEVAQQLLDAFSTKVLLHGPLTAVLLPFLHLHQPRPRPLLVPGLVVGMRAGLLAEVMVLLIHH